MSDELRLSPMVYNPATQARFWFPPYEFSIQEKPGFANETTPVLNGAGAILLGQRSNPLVFEVSGLIVGVPPGDRTAEPTRAEAQRQKAEMLAAMTGPFWFYHYKGEHWEQCVLDDAPLTYETPDFLVAYRLQIRALDPVAKA